MALAPANTPTPGTGALTLESAVDALMTPLPPKRDTPPAPQDPPAETETDTDTPEDETEGTDTATDTSDADTEGDEPEQTDDDEEAAPSDEDTAPPVEPSYEVTVDGKKSTVPVSELVRGYQRQQAYTTRSQALAEERRAFESERSVVQQERSQYGRLLSALQAQIEGAGEQEPDWEYLQQTDPTNYPFHWARWQQRKDKLRAISQEQERLAIAESRDVDLRLQKHVQEQQRLLFEKVPEYRDEAVRKKDRDAIRDFAVETYGFTAEEIASLYDHRAVLVMRDARAYRELQKKKPVVEKRVVQSSVPLSAKRGPAGQAVPTQRFKAADARLSRTGRLEDAVELELARSHVRNPNGNGSRNR